jgi:hypothetical protein
VKSLKKSPTFLFGFRIKRISHLKILPLERIPPIPIKVYALIVKKGLLVSIQSPREEFGVAMNIDRETFLKKVFHESQTDRKNHRRSP